MVIGSAFGKDAGVSNAINDLAKLVQQEGQTRGAYSYVTVKNIDKNVVEGFSEMRLGFSQQSQNINQVNEKMVEVKGMLAKSERQRRLEEVHKKLMNPDAEQRKHYSAYDPVADTCNWILAHEDYKTWVNSDSVDSSILILTGDEGCGKTYLVSEIIRGLVKQYPQGKDVVGQASVACYFFKSARKGAEEAKKGGEEATRVQGEDQYCTAHMALKALSYQLAENDPIYRKNLLGLENEVGNKVADLCNVLFIRQEQGAKAYVILDGLHELEDRQLHDLGRALRDVASQSSKAFATRILVTGRSKNIDTISNELGRSTTSINVTEHSGEDVAKFVRNEVDSFDSLRRLDGLRDEICTSLTQIEGITFGQADFFLQKIRNKRRTNEIMEVLEKAKQNSSFHDNIANEIEECNQKLLDEDIRDLNQLLEWVMAVDWTLTLSGLEAVLHVRPGRSSSTALDSLYKRLKSDFSTFFVVDPDRDVPDAEVRLRSQKIKEYFEETSRSDNDETESSTNRISKLEVEIVDRFLKNICDESLYEKFQFKQFFMDEMGPASKITVNMDEIDAKVALDCIRVARGQADAAATGTLSYYAHSQYPSHLAAADLAYLNPKLKSEIGKLLVPMFYSDVAVEVWRLCGDDWMVDDEREAAVLKWFGDTAAMKSFSSDKDAKAWIDSVTNSFEPGQDLFEHVAKVAAKTWLLGDGCEDLFDMVIESFRFVRAYHNKVSNLPPLNVAELTTKMQINRKKDDGIKKFDYQDYYEPDQSEDLSDFLNWAHEQDILTETSYVPCFRLAETYRSLKNYDDAEELLKEAIQMQPDACQEARRSLAKLYSQKDQFDLAVETMQAVAEGLKKLSEPTEKQQENLKDCLQDIAEWNKKRRKYDEAMQIYQEMLRDDAENYGIVCNMLSVLADQNVPQQVLDHLNSLSTQTDAKTGNDRLTQLLFACADDDEVHNIISHSARELRYLNLIREIYEKAIDVAEKERGTSGTHDDRLVEVTAAIVQLKNHLAHSIHRHNESELDAAAAVELWCEVTTLRVDSRIFWNILEAKRSAAKEVCLYYMSEARRQGHADADAAKAYVDKLESFFDGLPEERGTPLEEYEFKRMLGYHLASMGQQVQAREQLKSAIELGVELLSDGDVSNDHRGYNTLADAFMRLKDEDNALAAWSLIGPNKNEPLPAADGSLKSQGSNAQPPDVTVNGASANATKKAEHAVKDQPAAAAAPTAPAGSDPAALDPPSRGLMRRATSDLAKRMKAPRRARPKCPMGRWCDCARTECHDNRGHFTFADDFYYCRQCPDVQFTPACLEQMRQGKLRRHICHKDHDFYHVPPWDFEKAWRVGKGNVQVGEKIMTARQWLDGIRQDWGIEKKSNENEQDGVDAEKNEDGKGTEPVAA